MERIYTDTSVLNFIGKAVPQKLNKRRIFTGKMNLKGKAVLLGVIFVGIMGIHGWSATIITSSSGNWSATAWPNTLRTGTISIPSGSAIVTGNGTAFSSEISVGNIIKTNNNTVIGTVASITDDSHLILASNVTIARSGISFNSQGVGPGDDVIIYSNNNTITVDVTAVCKSLSTNSDAKKITINISPGQSLTVSGGVTINGGAGNFDTRTINVGTGTFTCASILLADPGADDRGIKITLSAGTITVYGNIIMNGSAVRNLIEFTGAGILNVGGNMNGGSLIPLTGTVNYNGNNNQTFGAYTYYKLNLSGTDTKTAAGAISVTNALTINTGVTLDMAKFKLTGSTLTTSGTGTLKTQYVSSSSDLAIPNDRTWSFDVEYYAPDAQAISNGTYTNLILTGKDVKSFLTSTTTINQNLTLIGEVTASAAAGLSIGGNVTIGSGTTFTAGNFIHTVGGDWTNNGTFTNGSGTITFNSTSTGKILSGNLSGTSKFNKLIFNGVGGGWNLNDNTEIGGSSTALDIRNGVLTVSGGKYLDVKNGSTTLGSLQCLILKSDGTNGTASFIDNGSIDGTGTAKIERYLVKYDVVTDQKFHFLSSPVSGQLISPEFMELTTLWTDFYRWDESQNYWISYRDLNNPSTLNLGFGETNLATGKGYLVAYPSDVTKNFIGKPYTNATGLKITCTYTSNAGKGWNLIGNPFPSAIDWNSISTSGMDDALYFYDNAEAQYRYYHKLSGDLTTNLLTTNGYIPAMQGFMMHASSSGGSVTIANSDREHQNMTLFYKSATLTENVLTIKVEGSNVSDAARICFYDQATVNFDGQFDVYKLFSYNPSVPNLYSITPDQTKVAINTLPLDQMYGTVPVGFTPGEAGTYTITADGISNFPSTMYIKLEDKKTNSIQKLNDNPVYSFTATPGDDSTRFVLHFQDATAINNPEVTNNLTIYVDNGTITINQLESTSGKVKVSDMLGRTVAMENMVADTPLQINLSSVPGVYVVTVYTKAKTYSQKVVIR